MLFKNSFQARDFQKLKPAILQLAQNIEFGIQFETSEEFWEKLDELLNVLQIPYLATKQMQRIGYGLTDFYISWLRMKRSLGRLANGRLNLAERMITALHERENILIDTPTMATAMYLDPRIKYKLSDRQAECAKLSLNKLHDRINSNTLSSLNESSNDTLDEINAEAMGSNRSSGMENNNLAALHDSFERYNFVQPTNIKLNVMDFWKDKKQVFPVLYELACIVHAVQAGQCSVESNFSAFQCIMDSRRFRLHAENISNILLIRLNPSVYETWKQNNVSKLLES